MPAQNSSFSFMEVLFFPFSIIVLISDGQANSGSEPNYVARDLKSQGITIFAVGVAGINKDELEAVATSQEHIYMLRNFAYIKQVNDDLRTGTRSGLYFANLNFLPAKRYLVLLVATY